jgi:hypothetical protein
MKKIWYILLAIGLACTNPFSTRTPEKPTGNQPIQPVNSLQTNPDSLLAKMKYAFRDRNVNFYLDCLADANTVHLNFTFVPQQNESYRLVAWTRQDEYNYFNRLVSNKDIEKITLQIYNLRPWSIIGSSQDTMQTRFNYEIELDFKTRQEYYRGESVFKVVRSSQSLWYITYWEDLALSADHADSTWSTLKANYR